VTTKTPIKASLACQRIAQQVTITGVRVALVNQGRVIASEDTRLACTGITLCGVLLGSPTCPYQASRNSGN
jgi:hypothetical protein